MTNVLIFNPLGLENGRGGEISAMELASGLKKFYNITLMDTNLILDKVLLSKNSIIKRLHNLKKIRCMRFAQFKFLNKLFTFPFPNEIFRLYKTIRSNDIIYISNFTIKTNLIFIFFNLLHRKSILIVGHRKPLFSEKFLSIYNLKNRISILLFTIFKKRILHHTISAHAKKFLEKFYTPNRVIHITHGVELDNFDNSSLIQKSSDQLKFIYIGYLDDIHKGVAILFDGIEKLILEKPNLRIFFEFCGAGPLESRLNYLQGKYPEYIKYNGYIDNLEISDFYKRNDVFLFTSRREPFGRVIIEALASNLLILCTKTYGSIEILKDMKFAFFISELNSENIKNKLYLIYQFWEGELNKFRELQESAKNYAYRNYSFLKELNMFKMLIDRIYKK